ncbi:sigma-70 family RNA polymerase sigma factor [Dyadobacter chenwenxiniae]|uniref:Sigma-70 family RNA polymerase sigma factor n=1 Tax=Dyadobacter chenwenxiniae TaxID=2906456 RepID=A0A9X1PK04_9BACT|nr:sigma-70 family RNA polymerase sigma factor [Dyadobacter chenwenxiniae]MCF0048829.1 sigma-70 family RNA polymerase sigma factor [Dyadobacter chenwenxiniae]MCF0062333.1 sigma-70 family RNA polymerase sigma factor [Dyadobacter chenwenxiniae]UON83911.1 sigma-70 family RNA polymerase sigma factor [Dyadobacter chenwenxiniae]
MDLQAFNQRILPVQGRLFRLAQMFLRNREEAEDAIQDVLLRLWTNRQQLETYHSIEALAVQMTKNLCLDRLKSHHKQKMQNDADVTSVHAAELSPHRQLENSDSAALIHRLIGELPEQHKLVLHLRDVEECSFEEIEQVTGLSNANIRTILSRARQKLRENYLKANDYESGY